LKFCSIMHWISFRVVHYLFRGELTTALTRQMLLAWWSTLSTSSNKIYQNIFCFYVTLNEYEIRDGSEYGQNNNKQKRQSNYRSTIELNEYHLGQSNATISLWQPSTYLKTLLIKVYEFKANLDLGWSTRWFWANFWKVCCSFSSLRSLQCLTIFASFFKKMIWTILALKFQTYLQQQCWNFSPVIGMLTLCQL